MNPRSTAWASLVLVVASVQVCAGPAPAAEIKVMLSGGLSAGYRELAPGYERTTGHAIVTTRGASMGDSVRSIPSRLRRGEAEVAFQQISELVPVAGIDYVGPLPPELQKVTVFAAGISVGAREVGAARAFIKHLASSASAPAFAKSGLEPIASP